MRRVYQVGTIVVLALLLPVFFKPTLYSRMEEHLFFESGISKTIPAELKKDGFARTTLTPIAPPAFFRKGYVDTSGRSYFTKYYRLAGEAKLNAALPDGGTAEIAVWVRGDPALPVSSLRIGDQRIQFGPNRGGAARLREPLRQRDLHRLRSAIERAAAEDTARHLPASLCAR